MMQSPNVNCCAHSTRKIKHDKHSMTKKGLLNSQGIIKIGVVQTTRDSLRIRGFAAMLRNVIWGKDGPTMSRFNRTARPPQILNGNNLNWYKEAKVYIQKCFRQCYFLQLNWKKYNLFFLHSVFIFNMRQQTFKRSTFVAAHATLLHGRQARRRWCLIIFGPT